MSWLNKPATSKDWVYTAAIIFSMVGVVALVQYFYTTLFEFQTLLIITGTIIAGLFCIGIAIDMFLDERKKKYLAHNSGI